MRSAAAIAWLQLVVVWSSLCAILFRPGLCGTDHDPEQHAMERVLTMTSAAFDIQACLAVCARICIREGFDDAVKPGSSV